MADVKDKLIQQRIIKKSIKEPSFYKKIKNLRVNLFEGNPELEDIYSVMQDYYLDNPDKEPTKDSLNLYASAKLDRKNATPADRMKYADVIEEMYKTNQEDDQEVFDEHISSYIKTARLTASLKTLLMKDLDEKAIDQFEKDFDDIRQESADTGLHEVVDVMDEANKDDIAQAILDLKHNVIQIPNNQGLTDAAGGGLAKGEMGAIAGQSGYGKTGAMASLAMAYVSGGYNVLYIALEELAGRMYTRFYNPYLGYVRKVIPQLNPQDISGSLERISDGYANGQLTALKQAYENITHVKQGALHFTRYSPHTLTVEGLRQVVHDVIVTNGNDIDVILIDYPDLLSLDMSEGEATAGGKMYEDLRAIGQDYNTVMWVASQMNRSAGMSDVKTETSIEGSFRKINALEQLMIINSSSEEVEGGYTRLYIAKSRNGGNRGQLLGLRVEPDTKLVREETPDEANAHENILNQAGNQMKQDDDRNGLATYESKSSEQENFRARANKQMGAM